MDKQLTPEAVVKIIKEYYIKHYGKLSNPDIERDGYFIAGFVQCALSDSLTTNNNNSE